MESVTMLEFRRQTDDVLRRLRNGERLLLTYRGRPVATLEPVNDGPITADDPFYSLDELADENAPPLTNEEMDRAVYGE